MSSSKKRLPKKTKLGQALLKGLKEAVDNQNKPQTLIEKYKAIQKIGTTISTPYRVYCLFKECKELSILGSDISFGEDYMPLFRAREVIGWFVHQLGGSVQWRVEDE